MLKLKVCINFNLFEDGKDVYIRHNKSDDIFIYEIK